MYAKGGLLLDGVEKLLRMADLIRSRPDITSRELADQLGYAEVKSIYYWLEKNGFTLREFRRAVLRGEWPPGQNRLALREHEPYDPVRVQLIRGFSEEGEPITTDTIVTMEWAKVRYALRWEETSYPCLLPGDILLLSDRPPRNGETVLSRGTRPPLALYRYYRIGDDILFLDLLDPRRIKTEPLPVILAVVAGVLRSL